MFGMLLTHCPVIYLVLEICNDLLQQALEAMAQCIAVGSSKVSNVIMNGMRKLKPLTGIWLPSKLFFIYHLFGKQTHTGPRVRGLVVQVHLRIC